MLQKFPLNQISQSDTLNYRMHQLQMKVDSLSKIVNKTEIGTGFFSEIISLQLGVFILIISFSGLISWRWFTVQMNRIRAENKKYTDKGVLELENNLNIHKDDVKEKINDVEDSLNITSFNVNRSMFFASQSNSDFPFTPVTWGLSAIIALIDYDREDKELLVKSWIKLVSKQASLVKVGDSELKERIDDTILQLVKIDSSENLDDEDKELIRKIKELLLHLAYTQAGPPEDLADGHANTPLTTRASD